MYCGPPRGRCILLFCIPLVRLCSGGVETDGGGRRAKDSYSFGRAVRMRTPGTKGFVVMLVKDTSMCNLLKQRNATPSRKPASHRDVSPMRFLPSIERASKKPDWSLARRARARARDERGRARSIAKAARAYVMPASPSAPHRTTFRAQTVHTVRALHTLRPCLCLCPPVRARARALD